MVPQGFRITVCAILLTGVASHAVAQQDDLAAAKELYRAASYSEALARFESLRTGTFPAPADTREIERYRAFCLIALDRIPEAVSGIEAIVVADPTYVPRASEVSPRVSAVFHDTRAQILAGIARDTYAAARSAFDRKEYAAAAVQFERTLALLDDADVTAGESAATDLALLTTSFLELSRALAGASQGEPTSARPRRSPGGGGSRLARGTAGPSPWDLINLHHGFRRSSVSTRRV
jgi:hypothetical protein